jgi:hypothetical protein
MATLESVTTIRRTLAFMTGFLPALDRLGIHARSSFAALVLQEHENRPLVVGRLHYSLRSTLSAHFRWCFGASERLYIAS